MLQDLYSCSRAIARLRDGPAGTHLDHFVDWLTTEGYTFHSQRAYVPAAVEFASWAQQAGRTDCAFDQHALDEFRAHLAAEGRWVSAYGKSIAAYTGARRFVAFLRQEGLTKPNETSDPGLAAFRAWLLQRRGLAPFTVDTYLRAISRLVAAMGSDPQKYDPASLRRFVLDKARNHSTSTAKNLVTAVRNYLRYLIATGACRPGLDEAVPRIAGWQLSTLPRYLEPRDLERVVEATSGSTVRNAVRDRAVVLLLARLALRARDVATLRLADIDWEAGRVKVSGKARKESLLPLPQEVGDAILAYLDGVRPACHKDAVFINSRAPYGLMGSHTVSQIAKRAILRAGVEAPSLGAHVFRHSAATALLRRGTALKDISALLRHDSVESTAYYAKVDLDTLKSIAQPWPGRPA